MIHPRQVTRVFLAGIFSLIACSNQVDVPPIPATQTASPIATSTPLPNPFSPGDTIFWGTLQVTMDKLEISNEYITDFGPTRIPPSGKSFLWVHIRLKNTSQVEMSVPSFEHYSILYAAIEIKPIYGHRSGYTDYTTLSDSIFPDQSLDGWLRFDIPDTAELNEMRFVFLPESVQIGTSYSSPSYPYSRDKPTYVWNCTP